MTYIINDKDKFNFVYTAYLQTLNNLQNITSRLSNIGFIIFTLAGAILSIMFPILFSINFEKIIRFFISIILLISIILFWFCSLLNLRNEKVFRNIYNEKTKINILEINENNEKDFINKILSIDFENEKKKIKICLISWYTLIWFFISSVLLINIFLIWYVFY